MSLLDEEEPARTLEDRLCMSEPLCPRTIFVCHLRRGHLQDTGPWGQVGPGQKAKRLTLFSSLIDGPWDIIVLQETHHIDEVTSMRSKVSGGTGGRRRWKTMA